MLPPSLTLQRASRTDFGVVKKPPKSGLMGIVGLGKIGKGKLLKNV